MYRVKFSLIQVDQIDPQTTSWCCCLVLSGFVQPSFYRSLHSFVWASAACLVEYLVQKHQQAFRWQWPWVVYGVSLSICHWQPVLQDLPFAALVGSCFGCMAEGAANELEMLSSKFTTKRHELAQHLLKISQLEEALLQPAAETAASPLLSAQSTSLESASFQVSGRWHGFILC